MPRATLSDHDEIVVLVQYWIKILLAYEESIR